MNKLQTQIEQKIKKYFKIGFFNTEANNTVKDTFVQFCTLETDGNYLQGIKKLLENYSLDWKYASLYEELQSLKVELNKFKVQPLKEEDVKVYKTFGRNKNE